MNEQIKQGDVITVDGYEWKDGRLLVSRKGTSICIAGPAYDGGFKLLCSPADRQGFEPFSYTERS
jgi:hypothetical protein